MFKLYDGKCFTELVPDLHGQVQRDVGELRLFDDGDVNNSNDGEPKNVDAGNLEQLADDVTIHFVRTCHPLLGHSRR